MDKSIATCWTRPSSPTRMAIHGDICNTPPNRRGWFSPPGKCKAAESHSPWTDWLFEKGRFQYWHLLLSIPWDPSALARISNTEPTWLVFTTGEMGGAKSFTMNRCSKRGDSNIVSIRCCQFHEIRRHLQGFTSTCLKIWSWRVNYAQESGFIANNWHLWFYDRETAFQLTGYLARPNDTRSPLLNSVRIFVVTA